jgi:hypothetical protein
MRQHAVEVPINAGPSSAATSSPRRILKPLELARWVEVRSQGLAERWLQELRARDTGSGDAFDGLVEPFIRLFVSMLPTALGPLRDQVEPIWVQTAELFGSVSSQRGLAAGEVIEEFQLLRDGVIRAMFEDSPLEGDTRLSLRDVLRLNRIVDLGVTHASVGHTDALFFSLFQGSGVPDSPGEDLYSEVAEQLGSLRREFAEVKRALKG